MSDHRSGPVDSPPLVRGGAPRQGLSFLFSLIKAMIFLAICAQAFLIADLFSSGLRAETGRAHMVVIAPGSSVRQIGDRLQQAGAIRDSRTFGYWARLWGADTKLQAGEYVIPSYASLFEIMNLLKRGEVIFHRLTIPEGWSSKQIAHYLSHSDLLAGPEIAAPPEGSILPDTYLVARGTRRDELLALMIAEHDQVVAHLWADRQADLPLANAAEAVILASIVEKETAVADELPRVAAVFINRLRRRMRLESDPTVIYGITGGAPLGRGLTRQQIDTPTDYNTYRMKGLPPTPICNPGREAIQAVLNPIESDELFFVADGKGGHAFATTYDEHRRNVKRWRAVEAEQKR